ncbi:MFS transporter [Curtobacterium sp. MCSS17_008]|uniref:MFS transporter n=1 Tax=Curtobacterium sp. MCSS17_008 TaxID=2175647 RepID=UPI000DA72009|nr:MFS transporter [Curtobacterium sp. MCSS17_008]PZF56318.1 MFS transporter [Curtobacterium sp. MCSS17_008]
MTVTPDTASTRTSGPVAPPTVHRTVVLAIVLVSYFMIVLDNSIIFTGLPEIQRGMDLSPTALSWVQNAYTLVFGGLLLLGARAGDLLGRQRVFVVGLALFGLASLLVGTAQNEAWIIAARAFQGVGAAIVAPSSLSLITATFPAGPERTRAVSLYGTTAGVGASLGMVVGGALAGLVSWRAGFFINVPIALVMIVLAVRYLPQIATIRGHFDLPGAVTSTIGMGSLVYGIVNGGDLGWTATATLVPVAVGAVVLAVFVLNEWRAVHPIMPLRLFADAGRSGAAVSRLLFAGTGIAFFFFTTQFLQGVYGWSALQAGIAFLPMTLLQFAVSLFVPGLTRRFGNAVLVAGGIAIVLVAVLWLTRITPDVGYLAGFAGPLVLFGIGQGLSFGPLTAAGIAGAPAEDAGAASGLVNTAHQLGSTLGVAVLTAVGAAAATLSGRVSDAYTGAAVMLVIALVATLALVLPADRRARARAANGR